LTQIDTSSVAHNGKLQNQHLQCRLLLFFYIQEDRQKSTPSPQVPPPVPPPLPPLDWAAAEATCDAPPPPPPPPPAEFQAAEQPPPRQCPHHAQHPPADTTAATAAQQPAKSANALTAAASSPSCQRRAPAVAQSAEQTAATTATAASSHELLHGSSSLPLPSTVTAAEHLKTAPLIPSESAAAAAPASCSGIQQQPGRRQSSAELEGKTAAAAEAALEDGDGENCWIAAGQDVCPWEDE
jgi:hypothetical protein